MTRGHSNINYNVHYILPVSCLKVTYFIDQHLCIAFIWTDDGDDDNDDDGDDSDDDTVEYCFMRLICNDFIMLLGLSSVRGIRE